MTSNNLDGCFLDAPNREQILLKFHKLKITKLVMTAAKFRKKSSSSLDIYHHLKDEFEEYKKTIYNNEDISRQLDELADISNIVDISAYLLLNK